MRKKNLLNESTVRRFMKLANIDTVGSKTLSEMHSNKEDMEERMHAKRDMEEDMEEGMGMRAKRDEMEERMHAKRDIEEGEHEGDKPELDFDDDDAVPDSKAGEELELDVTAEKAKAAGVAADLLRQIADAAMGMDDAGMDDMDMDDMGMDDMGMDDMGMDDKDMDDKDMDDMDPLDEIDIIDENALVSEVTRRVSSRLRKMLKNSKR